MFFKNTKEESVEVKRLDEVISDLRKERDEVNNDHKKDIKNLEKDHEIILKRKDAEVDVKVSEATAELKKELAQVTSERNDHKKEAEILTKAFENLGFDVKDMKDILNKLVDGVVAKNQVNVISGK